MHQTAGDDAVGNGFVHTLIVAGEAVPGDEILREFRSKIDDALTRLPGFHRATILQGLDTTDLCVVTEWAARDDWAGAQWDTVVQDIVVGLFRSGTRTEESSYRVIFREQRRA
ncbi:MAG TPA: hypothetical protein VFB22_13910 [Candidatus Baltobacteraceae bacterium]|nr:hypothetical protein [Candidatus Baltobacteraceae bacterium]